MIPLEDFSFIPKGADPVVLKDFHKAFEIIHSFTLKDTVFSQLQKVSEALRSVPEEYSEHVFKIMTYAKNEYIQKVNQTVATTILPLLAQSRSEGEDFLEMGKILQSYDPHRKNLDPAYEKTFFNSLKEKVSKKTLSNPEYKRLFSRYLEAAFLHMKEPVTDAQPDVQMTTEQEKAPAIEKKSKKFGSEVLEKSSRKAASSHAKSPERKRREKRTLEEKAPAPEDQKAPPEKKARLWPALESLLKEDPSKKK